jgi:hypothetical protein
MERILKNAIDEKCDLKDKPATLSEVFGRRTPLCSAGICRPRSSRDATLWETDGCANMHRMQTVHVGLQALEPAKSGA